METEIEDAAENWVVAFQGEPLHALATLVIFFLRLCGCDASVDPAAVTPPETVAETLESIQDAFSTYATAQYPIVSRAKPMKGVRKNAARLLEQLMHNAAEAELIGDDTLLDTVQAWLGALAQSPLRSFRHTGTLVTLWMLGALSAQLEAARDSYDVAARQRDAEATKTGANRTRLSHTADRITQLDALRDTLDAHMDELITQVFVPRVRDVDGAIRLDCIDQLAHLLKTYPRQYLQEFYFRHLGAALSDPEASVRLRTVRGVQPVLGAHPSAFAPFVERYKKRLVEMALYDTELSVRTAAFGLLETANEHQMLTGEERSQLAVHIFDVDARIRSAAAAFLAPLVLHEAAEATPLAHVRTLAALLERYNAQLAHTEQRRGDDVDVDPTLVPPVLGHIAVAIEAIWDAVPSLRPWQPYLDMLLEDTERTADAEAVAVEMVVAIVRCTRERGETDAEGIVSIEACSQALVPALPTLLSRFSAESSRIADLLLLVQYMELDVYNESQNQHAFETLWDDIVAHLVRHSQPWVLHNAAEALQRLAAAPAAVGTKEAKVAALRDEVLTPLETALDGRAIDTAVLTEDDVHTIHASLARLHALLKAMDVSEALEEAVHWDHLVHLAGRGHLGYEHEQPFVVLALSILALYLFWLTNAVLDSNTPTLQLEERRRSVLDVVQGYLAHTDPKLAQTVRLPTNPGGTNHADGVYALRDGVDGRGKRGPRGTLAAVPCVCPSRLCCRGAAITRAVPHIVPCRRRHSAWPRTADTRLVPPTGSWARARLAGLDDDHGDPRRFDGDPVGCDLAPFLCALPRRLRCVVP